jgi:hypothetical protein
MCVGLDDTKRVNLFKQYHLLGLPELASLNHIDIHTSRVKFNLLEILAKIIFIFIV